METGNLLKLMPAAGDFPEASTKVLNDEDLRNKAAWELRVMRNEIFARLGYKFKSEDMRDHFLNTSWYNPMYDNVDGMLSNIETENIELIKRYEIHLGSYNESYAR
jgi:hypothetical protein